MIQPTIAIPMITRKHYSIGQAKVAAHGIAQRSEFSIIS